MQRREFIGLIGGAAAWPHFARAQQSSKPKVGYVWIGERSTDVSGAGLRQGLVDKGYEIGRNLAFEGRYAHGDIEKVPALIAELLALKVDVLVTVGTSISLAARRATSTVPIVCISGDPVGTGLVASLSRPAETASRCRAVESRQSEHRRGNGSVADSGARAEPRFDCVLGEAQGHRG